METVTQEQVEAAIAKELDYKLGSKTCAVVLTLKNGFEVTGTSACVDEADYDHQIGVRLARQKAIDQVWTLLAFELQSLMAAEGEVTAIPKDAMLDNLQREAAALRDAAERLQGTLEGALAEGQQTAPPTAEAKADERGDEV